MGIFNIVYSRVVHILCLALRDFDYFHEQMCSKTTMLAILPSAVELKLP